MSFSRCLINTIDTNNHSNKMIIDMKQLNSRRRTRRASSSSPSQSSSSSASSLTENDQNGDLNRELAEYARARVGSLNFSRFMKNNSEEFVAENLFKGAIYIAQHNNADLVEEEVVRKLDEIVQTIERELITEDNEERFPLRTMKKISKILFEQMLFKGNSENYYDANNSCVDKVLETKTGIPITLSLIYMECAKRVGINMVGVNLPGHFMIRPLLDECEIMVDCFNKGQILFVEDAEEMLSKLYYGVGGGEENTNGGGEKVTIDRSFLKEKALNPRTFYTRMITNLKSIYFTKGDYKLALMMCNYQRSCAPDEKIYAFNCRDSGMCNYLLEQFSDAFADLTEYLDATSENIENVEDRRRIEDLREQARVRWFGQRDPNIG